jgi:hypothetical protein
LYWYIGKTVADYVILADWWSRNTYGCQLYIGQAPFLINAKSRDTAWQTPDEITKQIKLNRSYSDIAGSMFFSGKSLKANPLGVKENLKSELFKYPALTAPNPRVQRIIPVVPDKAVIRKKHRAFELSWEKSTDNRMFVIYKYPKKAKLDIENPVNICIVTGDQSVLIEKNRKTKTSRYNYAVTAISSTHNESEPLLFKHVE